MMEDNLNLSTINRIAFVGNYLPRQCGIAIFTTDLCEAIATEYNDTWFFGPEEPYELQGDVGNVVFPCGYTLAPDGDTIRLYYDAADASIALATGSVQATLDWLEQRGSREENEKGRGM